MSQLSTKHYEKLLEPLHNELVAMARWVGASGARIVVVFEGRDTAGKGGAIGAFTRVLNPRQCSVVALAKPSEREAAQWYFQRYVAHMPAAGEIVLFDRSWYNRAGVERVMGYASEAEVDRFLTQVPKFEQLLIDEGILLFKYWLTTDQERQEERLKERRDDPLKRWKLSPIDLAAREKYAAYTEAREAMLRASHTAHAPWTLVDFNDQKHGRLTLIRNLLDRLPDTHIGVPDLKFPSLSDKPQRESYTVIEPLPPFPVENDGSEKG